MPISNTSQLASIVRHIEQLEAAKADTTRAINHAYAAAKADGYDVRALRAVIRLRSWDEKALADHEARVDAYSDALFAFEHTPLGKAAAGEVTAYYNEIDPYAAQWLRNLIAAGQIAPGDVDERSIHDVSGDDLRGYEQAHFFAGIGGWSYALRLAGWDDARPVWTGSCPCQPFSAAGKGQAADDERHLWPDWFRLIRAARPPIIFGEQVEAAIGWGWLDLVHADLGAEGYATGFAVLPAASVGAPHIRQRLWFVGDADEPGWQARDGVAVGNGSRSEQPAHPGSYGLVADALPAGRPEGRTSAGNGSPAGSGGASSLVDAASEQAGLPGRARQSRSAPWANLEWLPCSDGKARPVEPGTFPLAHGIPGRVGRLRAYGNAITPQCAAEFIRAATGRP